MAGWIAASQILPAQDVIIEAWHNHEVLRVYYRDGAWWNAQHERLDNIDYWRKPKILEDPIIPQRNPGGTQ